MQVKLMGLTRVAFMIGVGLVFAPAHSLRASAFHVTPIRVDFDRNTTSTVMTLVNESTEELRFQISVASWQQDKQGQMQLSPTDDIVFFPALLSLKAGEERGAGTYQEALTNEHLPTPFIEYLRTTLLPQSRAHTEVLERFLASAS